MRLVTSTAILIAAVSMAACGKSGDTNTQTSTTAANATSMHAP